MHVKSIIYKKPAVKLWNDWHWQMKNRYRSAEELSSLIPISDDETAGINMCLKSFRMAVTPYYASLIDPADPDCPIKKQCVPSPDEACIMPYDMADPLNEEGTSPVPHIVHRYPNRVLFLVTYQCSMYCRHCTRKRVVGETDMPISEFELKNALNYIRSNPQIEDVLISGGDPFTLDDDKLERILKGVRAINHVKIIRIGTRTPVVMPMRITPKILAMLKKYSPIWVNTHFNHPKEITEQSHKACLDIVNAGIPLGNQNVLLRGINDDAEVLKELYMKLVAMKVRPYYMYQCDLSWGLNHFRTDISRGLDIMDELTGTISGIALPKYVVDAPDGGGKIPISHNHIVASTQDEYTLKNYKGELYTYPVIK